MFPNPQDALPLPPNPNLQQYRKIAKDLVKACKSGESGSIRSWAQEWIQDLVRLSGLVMTPTLPVHTQNWIDEVEKFAKSKLATGPCRLVDAQFVIARSHGFSSWPKFSRHLEAAVQDGSSVSKFEAAADAIVSGDSAALERLLREQPKLVHARSTREHAATLLHYVSANGVEGYRQRTPQNIVEIAAMLLRAGAEIDATADVYGGRCTTLGLAATSVHPERAGVQEELLELLLEYGANMDQPSSAGNRQSLVTACLANGRPNAAEFLARRGAPLDFPGAAGLGRLEAVRAFVQEGVAPEPLKAGFLFACEYGRNPVIEFLIGKGVDPVAADVDGQTGLHWAVIGGQLDTVKLLLRHGTPLEARNRYGGTVLGQALWSAANGGDPDVYIADSGRPGCGRRSGACARCAHQPEDRRVAFAARKPYRRARLTLIAG